jgi:hypothetical protein
VIDKENMLPSYWGKLIRDPSEIEHIKKRSKEVFGVDVDVNFDWILNIVDRIGKE